MPPEREWTSSDRPQQGAAELNRAYNLPTCRMTASCDARGHGKVPAGGQVRYPVLASWKSPRDHVGELTVTSSMSGPRSADARHAWCRLDRGDVVRGGLGRGLLSGVG